VIPGMHQYWRALANGERTAVPDRLILALLFPFSLAYALLQRLRAALYRTGVFRTRRLPRPVISVGNLTVGGTGKTPVTAHIARLLLDEGYRVAVLSRGYGGSLEGRTAIVSDGVTTLLTADQCGDEPYLLASTIPGLMVIMGSDRYGAGMLAMERLSPDIFLLDDGYQHLRLFRDLNLLLLDATRPFGNGMTLPAGLLREPPTAIERAHVAIFTRCRDDRAFVSPLPRLPHLTASLDSLEFVNLAEGKSEAPERMAGKRYLAFAGIAAPESFFAALISQGVRPIRTIAYPDHEPYNGRRLEELTALMGENGIDGAITTEKDGVKLSDLDPGVTGKILLARMKLRLSDPEGLRETVLKLLQ